MAAFSLLVAADVAGDKQNFELGFAGHPTVQELEAAMVDTYRAAFPGHPFNVGKIQIYDEVAGKWSDLQASSQLVDYMQLYAFNRGVVEVQKPIPPPRKLASQQPPMLRSASPATRAVPHSILGARVGAPPPTLSDNATHDEKVRAVFEEVDVNNNHSVEPEEFRRAFRAHAFDFSAATVADLFAKADTNQDGLLSLPEFQRFCEMYPTLLDSLYFRIRDYWEDFRQKQSINAARESLEANKESERMSHAAHVEAQHGTTAQVCGDMAQCAFKKKAGLF